MTKNHAHWVLHLRVEEAGGRLDNGSGAVESREGKDAALVVGEDGHELDADVLGLHVEGKAVGDGLGLAGVDGQVVLRGRQVVEDALVGGGVGGQGLVRGEGARHQGELDGAGLVVGHLEQGARGLAVDQAQANELGVGKGGRDFGVDGGRGGVGGGVL